jgi:formate dehydrogenase accessory protein FdhD
MPTLEAGAAMTIKPSVKTSVKVWTRQHTSSCDDSVATETAVALVYNGVSHAVMMATPRQLDLFARGFSLSEGIIDSGADLYDVEINERVEGIEIALSISAQCFSRLKEKRRSLTGRTGCGLCGAESLQQTRLPVSLVKANFRVSHAVIDKATHDLRQYQPLKEKTGAVHGAAWCNIDGNIMQTCEDVGRHNALDKLIGWMSQQDKLRQPEVPAPAGFLLISSRASYEMVQKAAVVNLAMVVAVSAPTSLAIEVAEQAGITLVGFSRNGRHVIYCHGEKLTD